MLHFLGDFAARYPADTELEARLRSYDLAYRMQTSAPEAVDLSKETAATKAMYGLDDKSTVEYGTNLLRASSWAAGFLKGVTMGLDASSQFFAS